LNAVNLFARAWRKQPRGGAVDEVVDEASVMEVADSSAYNSFARQPDGLPRERARSGRFRMAKLKY
jgi:hypothetical protein